MKWIEVTSDGRKTAIRADQIIKISEYPLGGKNLAKIGILGDTWGVITDDTYEDVVKRVTDLPVAIKEALEKLSGQPMTTNDPNAVVVLPNQVVMKLP